MENRVYVENRDNFWRDLLVRIALILLFIFLLIWLFPMPKLETFYDRIFADNIKIMQEAAKDYFNVERLPKEMGEKKKITLREMIDKKMVLPFLDRDGNACDFDKSYVEVIRMETEYVFKTNLSCPTKTDYVINHLGCYDVCESESCKEEELAKLIEYQYSRSIDKKVIDRYSCPTGYIVKGSSCIKESSIIDKIAANLTCPSGYTYNTTADICEKSISKTIDADMNCPTGYAYNENANACLKYITKDESPNAVCSSGTYNASTGKCVIGTSSSYGATRTCSSGTYNSSTGKCVIASSSSYNATPSCSNGTYDSGTGKCKVTTNSSYAATPNYTTTPGRTYAATPNYATYTSTIAATESKKWSCQVFEYTYLKGNTSSELFTRTYIGSEPRYTCYTSPSCLTTYYKYNECTAVITGTCSDSSYTYNRTNRNCTKQVTTISSYSCPSGGTLSGTTCNVSGSSTISSYSCPNGGSLSGTTCYATSTTYLTPGYSCPSGGTLSGTKCNVSSSTSINPTYTCPNGGTLNGTTCNVSGSSSVNPTYSCTNGSLIGGVCKVTTIDRKAPSYTCNGTLVGNKCTTVSKLTSPVDYVCKDGYTRAGTSCVKTITSSSIINGTPTYKQVSSKEYKWSRETYLAGWVRTGKTREITVKPSEIVDNTFTK